jgi:hypothetical protein
MLAAMIGNVVISEVVALTYVVLSEVEKTHALWGIGTRKCLTLYPRCRTNRGRYNRVQLYFVCKVCDLSIKNRRRLQVMAEM